MEYTGKYKVILDALASAKAEETGARSDKVLVASGYEEYEEIRELREIVEQLAEPMPPTFTLT